MDQGRSTSPRLSSKKDKPIPRDLGEYLGKLPPQALDLEEAILGALMLEKDALLEVVDFLKPDHFYVDSHKEIYSAMMEIFRQSNPVDMRTVVSGLKKAGKIEMIGGAHYIAQLTSKVSSAANVEYHSRLIIELAMKRGLIHLASGIHNDAYEDATDVFELLGAVDLELEEISSGHLTTAEKHVKEIAFQSVTNLQNRREGHPTGVLSGYDEVDKITNGWQKSDLIIVAARPGMGKSAFVSGTCYNVSKQGKPVGLISLEMPSIQVVDRMGISLSEVDPNKVRTGQISDMEFERFVAAQGMISNLPYYIDDTPMLNILEIRARARRMKRKHGLELLVVDYLQLINGFVARQGMNRDQEIGLITRTLKGIAKELDIPVIGISSLNRGVETRGGDKRPQLQDLRESGSIESDADVVIFLYRPEYYKITEDEDGFPTHGKAEFIFAKHRNGSLGTAVQKFIGKYTKFVSWEGSGTNYAPKAPLFDASGYKDVLPNEDRQSPPKTDDTPF